MGSNDGLGDIRMVILPIREMAGYGRSGSRKLGSLLGGKISRDR